MSRLPLRKIAVACLVFATLSMSLFPAISADLGYNSTSPGSAAVSDYWRSMFPTTGTRLQVNRPTMFAGLLRDEANPYRTYTGAKYAWKDSNGAVTEQGVEWTGDYPATESFTSYAPNTPIAAGGTTQQVPSVGTWRYCVTSGTPAPVLNVPAAPGDAASGHTALLKIASSGTWADCLALYGVNSPSVATFSYEFWALITSDAAGTYLGYAYDASGNIFFTMYWFGGSLYVNGDPKCAMPNPGAWNHFRIVLHLDTPTSTSAVEVYLNSLRVAQVGAYDTNAHPIRYLLFGNHIAQYTGAPTAYIDALDVSTDPGYYPGRNTRDQGVTYTATETFTSYAPNMPIAAGGTTMQVPSVGTWRYCITSGKPAPVLNVPAAPGDAASGHTALLKIASSGEWADCLALYGVDSTGYSTLTYEFWAKILSDAAGTYLGYAYAANGNPFFTMSYSGGSLYVNGVAKCSMAANAWNHFRVVLYLATPAAEVFLNGQNVGQVSVYDVNARPIRYLMFGNHIAQYTGAPTAYIDALDVSTDPGYFTGRDTFLLLTKMFTPTQTGTYSYRFSLAYAGGSKQGEWVPVAVQAATGITYLGGGFPDETHYVYPRLVDWNVQDANLGAGTWEIYCDGTRIHAGALDPAQTSGSGQIIAVPQGLILAGVHVYTLCISSGTTACMDSRRITAVLGDSDGDGLYDAFETLIGLNPNSQDSDGDGIPDPNEDTDNNGKSNAEDFAINFPWFTRDPGRAYYHTQPAIRWEPEANFDSLSHSVQVTTVGDQGMDEAGYFDTLTGFRIETITMLNPDMEGQGSSGYDQYAIDTVAISARIKLDGTYLTGTQLYEDGLAKEAGTTHEGSTPDEEMSEFVWIVIDELMGAVPFIGPAYSICADLRDAGSVGDGDTFLASAGANDYTWTFDHKNCGGLLWGTTLNDLGMQFNVLPNWEDPEWEAVLPGTSVTLEVWSTIGIAHKVAHDKFGMGVYDISQHLEFTKTYVTYCSLVKR